MMMGKVKKICFVVPRVHNYFYPNQNFIGGGSEKQVYLLSKSLAAEMKYEINLCIEDFGQAELIEKEKLKLWKSIRYDENRIIGLFKFFNILKKVNADIYIFRAANFGILFLVLLLKFILRKKTMYMVAHDNEVNFLKLKKMSGFLCAISMHFTYKLVDLLTVQSNYQKQQFIRNRKIEPDLISKNIYIPSNNNEKNPGGKYILWIGRIDTFKQPEIFLELVKKFPNEKFIMIGPAFTDKRLYHKHIKEKALNFKNLEFIDSVATDQISCYYQNAKFLVNTSTSEGFSNTFLEAFENECPVLSLHVNPDGIIEKYQLGYSCKGNLSEFYSNFEKLMSNPSLLFQFGKNANQYLKLNHHYKLIINDLDHVWNSRL